MIPDIDKILNDEILKKEAFGNMSEEKINALSSFIRKMQGKSPVEALPHIMAFIKSNESDPNRITKAEQATMLHAILGSMPREDRDKFSALVKIAESYKN